METERLIIDPIRETDQEDYFINISHDKKVLETFICRYADTLEEFDFSSYPGRRDLSDYAIRRKPEVILLNGPSSAGKSSIAKALRQKLTDSGHAVILSLDDYLQMSAKEPIWEDDVFAIMPRMGEDISSALREGNTVIIDHVITSARIYRALTDAVRGFPMKTVLVRCDVETLRRRETERGDRCAGSAEASLQYLYPKTGYELCVDSSEASPAALAEEIVKEIWQIQ